MRRGKWPFIQERDRGFWTGCYTSPQCPFKVCSTLAINFIEIYPRDEKKTHKKAVGFVWVFFTKLVKILRCNGGIQISNYLVIIIKKSDYNKKRCWKTCCPVEDCKNSSKNAPGHTHRGMEDAAGRMGARFYPTKPQPRHGGLARGFPSFGSATRARR